MLLTRLRTFTSVYQCLSALNVLHVDHYKTEDSSVFERDHRAFALEQVAHHIISDLTQPEVVLWSSGNHRDTNAYDEKDASDKIHRWLVCDQRVDVTAVMSTCEDQNHKNHGISTYASHTDDPVDN